MPTKVAVVVVGPRESGRRWREVILGAVIPGPVEHGEARGHLRGSPIRRLGLTGPRIWARHPCLPVGDGGGPAFVR